MQTDPKVNRARAWDDVVRAGLAIALIGALWSLLGSSGCVQCREASDLLGRANLSAAGALLYAIVLALSWKRPHHPIIFAAVVIAAGTHLTLLNILAVNHLFCEPCMVTAAGAFVSATGVVGRRPDRAGWALMALAASALVTYGGISAHVAAITRADREASIQAGRDALLTSPSIQTGTARIIAYTRPNCRYCEQLRQELLPVIRKELGGVAYEERPAHAGWPTPMVVVLGDRDTAFPGLPEKESLRRAVMQAKGSLDGDTPSGGYAVPR